MAKMKLPDGQIIRVPDGLSQEQAASIAKAAIAVGTDGLFLETHPNPAVAKSDGANMLKLDKLEELLSQLQKIRQTIKAF